MPTVESTQEVKAMPRGGKREGAGRKPTGPGANKRTQFQVRLNPTERELIEAKAKALNMTMADYLRFKALSD